MSADVALGKPAWSGTLPRRHPDACTLPHGQLVHILGGAVKPDPYHYVRTYCGIGAVDYEWTTKLVTCRRCLQAADRARKG